MDKRQFIVFGILFFLLLPETSAQAQRRKQDEPDWLQEDYVRQKWPESQFLHKLDNFDARGLNDEEKHQKFLRFEEDMKAELARNILVQVKSSSTTQTTQVDNWASGEGTNQVGSTSFKEQLEFNVNAEFSALTRTFEEKNKTYHVLVIINKHETAEKLVLKTSLLLDQYHESAKVALQRRRALNLQELQEGLESSNQRLATAIWLDVDIRHLDEYVKTQDAATELAGLIDELKLLKSEQEFREIQGDIVSMIQGSNFLEALEELEILEKEYVGREELTELKNSLRQSYQQHVKSQCPLLSDSECLRSLETYMSFFPDDAIMGRELMTKRERWFNSKIEAIHLYIDSSQLTEARQLWEELRAQSVYNERPQTIKAQERLLSAEQDAFIEKLKNQAETDPFAAWRMLDRNLRADNMLIAAPGVKTLRKDIGRTCLKTEIRNAKRSSPFGLTISLESSFRFNGYVLNNQFSTSGIALYGGIRGYSIGVFRRKVKPDDVAMTPGKRKKDHSDGYDLTGVMIRYWDGSSFRTWDSSNDPSLLDGIDELLGIGFAAVRSNTLELELGIQNELSRLQSSNALDGSNFYATTVIRIQLLKMARSRVYARGGGTVITDLNSSPRLHFDCGLGWTPMVGSKVENRETLVAKYR